MSDYTPVTDFSVKDGLTSGDAEKVILGADFDVEFAAIQTAIATKHDSGDFASQLQAEAAISALASASTIISPLRLWNWANDNASVVEDLQAVDGLAGNGDKLFFFDDTDDTSKALTVGNGLEISSTTIQTPSSTAGAGLTYSSGVLAVGAGSGITVNADDIAITDQAATTSNPIVVSSGAFDIDVTALTNIEGSALAGTDEFLVDDAGTPKAIQVQDMGCRIRGSLSGAITLAATDMNSIMKFTGTATLTLDENVTVDLPLGVPVVLINDHATQELTVQADTSVTLESVFHAGGVLNASDVVLPGGMAIIVQTETDVWQLAGDIKDA